MESELLNIEKYRKLKIPKRLGLVECWGLIKPLVASEVGGRIYTPVPYLTETSLYKIGYIFVRVQDATGCCGAMKKSYKILGPLNKYINKSYTTSDWCVSQLPTIKTTLDFLDFKVRIRSDNSEMTFCGYDYHQLRLSELMRPVENLQLNRDSHEDLVSVDRIGLIDCIGATKRFEIRASAKNSERIFAMGDGNWTILFGYQICHLDQTGVVVSVANRRVNKNLQWVILKAETKEDLPLQVPSK